MRWDHDHYIEWNLEAYGQHLMHGREAKDTKSEWARVGSTIALVALTMIRSRIGWYGR